MEISLLLAELKDRNQSLRPNPEAPQANNPGSTNKQLVARSVRMFDSVTVTQRLCTDIVKRFE